MLTNDATILKIKHEVLYEVAKLAYSGEFDDKKEDLPYKMIPGLKPKFRCCVYKEREIVGLQKDFVLTIMASRNQIM